jgi:phytoene dehydrogenase-like protein
VGKHVIVVGGGIAGLAAAIYLARAGRTVTIFEKRRFLGGRAITHLRRGFRFNLGPHAVFKHGLGASIYRELGVPVRGGTPRAGGSALFRDRVFRLPAGLLSLILTSLLTWSEKFEAAKILLRIRLKPRRNTDGLTVRQWLDQNIRHETVRSLVEALFRLATYSDLPEEHAATIAIAQLRAAMRGVVYVDEGWQKLVDSLHSHAVALGVNFVTSSRVVAVEHDGAVRGVELGELELNDRTDTMSVALPEIPPEGVKGTRLPADTVVLAVDPATAAGMVGDPTITESWRALTPVTLTCLDVALSRLPAPKNLFALGIDRPFYFSVHSRFAHLTPKDGALIHVAKYRKARAAGAGDDFDETGKRLTSQMVADEKELEALLDQLQPGWRDVLVHRRFLPSMSVAYAMIKPNEKRPAVATSIQGLYLAGDWVGDEGILSDASLASARAAARAIIAAG